MGKTRGKTRQEIADDKIMVDIDGESASHVEVCPSHVCSLQSVTCGNVSWVFF